MDKKLLIDQLSKSYIYSRNIIKEQELGINLKSKRNIDAYKNIVNGIENAINCLEDNDKYIIYNEVVLGKKGEWYYGYLSTPTYYRHRKAAYHNFLDCLNR